MLVHCCYCDQLATSRYCFLNRQDEVVDNPFCKDHAIQVYDQTRRSLEGMHKTTSLARDFLYRQNWDAIEMPPPMPADQAELLSKGAIFLP